MATGGRPYRAARARGCGPTNDGRPGQQDDHQPATTRPGAGGYLPSGLGRPDGGHPADPATTTKFHTGAAHHNVETTDHTSETATKGHTKVPETASAETTTTASAEIEDFEYAYRTKTEHGTMTAKNAQTEQTEKQKLIYT
ncbi:hypothetical protein ACI65C_013743 [Semiaphis heraclei]